MSIPRTFKTKKELNNRIIACGENTTIMFQAVGEMFERTIKNKPAMVIKGVILTDIEPFKDYEGVAAGETVQIILPAAAWQTLECDGEKLTNRYFMIETGEIGKGNKYRDATVKELEPE